jgi:predicted alpha/beta-hydrolase family hydrolase
MKTSLLMPLTAAAVAVLATVAVAVVAPDRPPQQLPVATAASPGRPAIDVFRPVVREPAARNGHYAVAYTLYRPADLGHGRLPVVVFGNGACRHLSNGEYTASLTLLAAHGFLVVAVGAFDEPVTAENGSPLPEVITDGITWAQRENRRRGSALRGRIDTGRVAVAGHSCGGIEALVAGSDPRVASVLSLDSGFFADGTLGYGRENLANLHTPALFLDGGPSDIAYANSTANFAQVTVPAVQATNPAAGHVGFWTGLRDGTNDVTMQQEAVTVLVNWLDFTLNGNRTARAYFLGQDCGLCTTPGWTVAARNF